MATQEETQYSSTGPTPTKTPTVAHPLCPLSASEITTSSSLIKSLWPKTIDLRFKTITLEEPPKAQLIPYLEAEHSNSPLPRIDRKVFVAYYIRNTVLSLTSSTSFT